MKVHFKNKDYNYVENDDLQADCSGVATIIYQKPITREEEEGVAVIHRVLQVDEDCIDAEVEFINEPGTIYRRQIYTIPFLE